MTIQEVVKLHELLANMQSVKRATFLPSNEAETDSHHAFSLALIAYDICARECPELDLQKVLLFALAHDLLEIVTGDEDTLHYTPEQHQAKQAREAQAEAEFDTLFQSYPPLRDAMYDYEKLDTPEAVSVFVLDKACTTWTHHYDRAENARTNRGLLSKNDVAAWADRVRVKINSRVHIPVPTPIMNIFEESFISLQELFDA